MSLLEGRNVPWVPEGGTPPRAPGSNHHLTLGDLLHAHSLLSSPESDQARDLHLCLLGTDWMDVLGACLGCTHTPGSMQDVPMRWDPARDVPAELVCTHLTQAVTLCTKERISFHSGAQSQLLMAFLPVPSTITFQLSQGPLLIGEGDSATTLAGRTVSKKVFAWVHWGWIGILAHIMVPGLHHQPLAQRQIQLSLPFPSRKTSMQISLMKCPNGVHRCMESLQVLGMKFTQKNCLLVGDRPIWRCVPFFSNNSKASHY